MKVGIDAISFSAPKTRVFFDKDSEWTQARAAVFSEGDTEALANKVKRGIGLQSMAVPDAHEDIVTFAANSVLKLLEQSNLNLLDVSHVIFATEGGVDFSKSASAYMLGALSQKLGADVKKISNVEVKFACVGSSYALEYASALIRSNMLANEKSHVIVVSSDVARYEMTSTAEYTQGAGAVAYSLCQNPSLLELDDAPISTAFSDERDFFRPFFKDTPTVDGKYSVDIYLDLVNQAYRNHLDDYFKKELKATPRDVVAESCAYLFHVPFPKMAEYMAARIFLKEFEKTEALDHNQLKEAEKQFRQSQEFKTLYASKVNSGLSLSRQIGNIYSASLPLCLQSLLCTSKAELSSLEGKRVLFFGYGSGACARVYSGIFVNGVSQHLSHFSSSSDSLHALSFSDYEALHTFHGKNRSIGPIDPKSMSVCQPEKQFVYLGMEREPTEKHGLRRYQYWS